MQERKKRGWSDSPAADLYNSSRWRKFAKWHKAQNPLCVKCLEKGIATPVDHTDHIQAVADGGDPYDMHNVQSLCKSCHFNKTMAEARARRKGKSD